MFGAGRTASPILSQLKRNAQPFGNIQLGHITPLHTKRVLTSPATHALQDRTALLHVAALNERVRGLWQQQAANEEHDGGDASDGQGDAPAVAARNLVSEVIDDL